MMNASVIFTALFIITSYIAMEEAAVLHTKIPHYLESHGGSEEATLSPSPDITTIMVAGKAEDGEPARLSVEATLSPSPDITTMMSGKSENGEPASDEGDGYGGVASFYSLMKTLRQKLTFEQRKKRSPSGCCPTWPTG